MRGRWAGPGKGGRARCRLAACLAALLLTSAAGTARAARAVTGGDAGGQSGPASPAPGSRSPAPGAAAHAADAPILSHLLAEAGSGAALTWHARTGKLRFFAAEPGRPVPSPAVLAGGPEDEGAARAFLRSYGPLFGLGDEARELRTARVRRADNGGSFVRFQQTSEGIPVLGAELVVRVDGAGSTRAAIGRLLPAREAPPAGLSAGASGRTGSFAGSQALPGRKGAGAPLDAGAARELALRFVAKGRGIARESLESAPPEPWIFNPVLLGGDRDVTSRVWLAEVRSAGPVPVREAVLVEAGTGAVVLHWDMLETAFSEQVWDNANNPSCGLPGCSLARTTGQGPTGQSDVDLAYDYAKDTWDYYHSQFGRDSLDGHGMPMVSTVRYCEPGYSCPFANAFWNGDQMVYGQGFASADDVVAHELTHGVTSHEAHLFYIFQSGALNESLSDIFGEFVDLTNGKGNDSPPVRWLLGEDLSIGAIRSMADPPAFGQPDRMHSPLYYCGMQDAGGVHENSGVTNRLAALLADGGTFNGRTIAGLGLAKVGRLVYDLDANWLTSASDFRDFHDALQASCAGLVGTAGISVADCNQVEDALLASETGLAEPCGDADDALVCPGGGPPALLYEADFENACAGWSGLVPDSGEEWHCGAWEPYGPYATSGVTSLFGLESPAIADYAAAMTSDIPVAGAGVYASFRHAHLLEQASMTTGYDGGVVEYSTNGGASWSDAGSLFAENGYNGTIDASYGNPLGSRPAFIAMSRGYSSSRLDLSPLSGHGVRLRFRLGTDDGGSLLGWYIDDVRIYSCPPANPGPTIAALSPLTVEAGRPAFRLAVEGSGFVEESVVLWNGAPRVTTLVGPGLLRAEIPAPDAAVAGTALVTVSNPAPGGGTSGARVLTISQPCAAAPLTDGRTDGALADGDCALESLLPGRRHDVYTFEAAAGRRVALRLESGAFDTILRVMTPDGTELSNDNCSRKTTASCLKPGAIAQSGTYTVTVTSLEGIGRGAYALKLSRK